MRKANTGLLRNVQPLNWDNIAQIENQILSNINKDTVVFYLEPNGDIRLLTNKNVSYDVRDIAFHKKSVLSVVNGLEIKQDYIKKNNIWVLYKTYNRIMGASQWQPVISKNTALLGKALLGKMILGRRY